LHSSFANFIDNFMTILSIDSLLWKAQFFNFEYNYLKYYFLAHFINVTNSIY